MSISFGDGDDELRKSKIETVRRLFVVKEYFNETKYKAVDVSDRVTIWGTLTGDSTLVKKSWRLPSFSPSLRNDDSYFSRDSYDSIWSSLGASPENCFLLFEYYIVLHSGTETILLNKYLGTIKDAVYRYNRGLALCEFITVLAQDIGMGRSLPRTYKCLTIPEGSW